MRFDRADQRRSAKLFAILAIVALVSGATWPAEAALAQPAGRHFVVLIDDSRDMRGYREQLQSSLPDFLYGNDSVASPAARPTFDPARDTLSVVFFTIHRDGPQPIACRKERRYSALPEHIFEVVPVRMADLATRQGFASQLERWLDRDCRNQGRLSPIATSLSLVLPYLGPRLADAKAYSRTFLINTNNARFNSTSPPGLELANFLRIQADIDAGLTVRDTAAAQELLQQAAPYFRFESPESWNLEFGPAKSRLFLNMYEAVPLAPTPEALITAPETIVLERLAVAPDKLRIDSALPGQAELRIEQSTPSVGGHLDPIRLDWRFAADGGGGPWSLGPHELPTAPQSLDLTDCAICRQEDGQLIVPLLALAGDLELRPSDPAPEGHGLVELSVTFRFTAVTAPAQGQIGTYDHLLRQTETRKVRLEPAAVETLPREAFFPRTRLDNRNLADLWKAGDQELDQHRARDRLLAQRDGDRRRILVGSVLAALAVLLAVLYLLYRTAYHRPFTPRLEWQAAEEVLVDFSQPAASRQLVGTLEIANPAAVPWFGRRLSNNEQPTRLARLRLTPPDYGAADLAIDESDSRVVGFLSRGHDPSSGEEAALTLETDEPVSNGKRIYLFLAAETIHDVLTATTDGSDFVADIAVAIDMSWRSGNRARGAAKNVGETLRFPLRVRAETARRPAIDFVADGSTLYYRQGERVQVGHFAFKSRARHRFAHPFEGEYLIRSSREHRPLAGDPIALARKRLRLPARTAGRVPAVLVCDGQVVANPEAGEDSYELTLVGNMHSSSTPGPHRIALHRDPTRAEAELRIFYQGEEQEIFWTPSGEAKARLWRDGAPADARALTGQRLALSRPFAFAFSDGTPPPNVLRFEIGNTARSGRGWVKAHVTWQLTFGKHKESLLHLRDAGQPAEILSLFDRQTAVGPSSDSQPHFFIREGEAAQKRELRLDPSRIAKIDGALITAADCQIEIGLHVNVRDDRGDETRRQVTLVVPLELEQLPGLNWLCIDFGTSAIAAAVGNCSEDAFEMIRLQDVGLRGKSNYGNQDRGNPEAETPFLPSWVICDSDQRLAEPKSEALKGWPQGFPLYQPASQRPGEASFLGLPALSSQLRDKPGRVIFSLKSWLAKGSPWIHLPERVRYQANGRQKLDRQLPLDEVVESSFAALAEAYLLREPHLRADQVAICHPNTFTRRHKKRLHGIAQRALTRRLDIAAPQHIKMVSESDAVAYYYCTQRMNDEPRSGSERILVYDFGAGTLDLSILQVDWQARPFRPRKWTVEGRIGVPVAGNHFDELLARLIDRQLRQPQAMANPALDYTYPLVGRQLPADHDGKRKYRNSIYGAWEAIRAAKHTWQGQEHFLVKVGDLYAEEGPITVDQYEDGSLPETPARLTDAGLCAIKNSILLAIPAVMVHADPRIAEFVEFVTETVVEEALSSAGVRADQIDTLLISGRGALWPGLRERLAARFPAAHKPGLDQRGGFLTDGVRMKEAVARGAIALQGLIFGAGESGVDKARARLGVLVGNNDLVPEEEWRADRPIDLSSSPTFRLVQVGLSRPDPRRDLETLKKHFYIDLNDQPYRRDVYWRKDPHLFISKEEDGDDLTIMLSNSDGQNLSAFGEAAAPAAQPPRPPWPVGQILLDPEE